MKNPMEDITAVVANWLTAERTLRSVRSFREFYPKIPLIVVDDDSNPKDKKIFLRCYSRSNYYIEYDPDTNKLRKASDGENYLFLQVPPHNLHPTGHGNAIDFAVKETKTRWMFLFHSDYFLTKAGLLEALTADLDDRTCGAGVDKTRHFALKALNQVAAIHNVELGKKFNLSFKPVIYHDDGTVTPYPGPRDGGYPVEASQYYIGRLYQLGYKIVQILGGYRKYGIHLRVTEEK